MAESIVTKWQIFIEGEALNVIRVHAKFKRIDFDLDDVKGYLKKLQQPDVFRVTCFVDRVSQRIIDLSYPESSPTLPMRFVFSDRKTKTVFNVAATPCSALVRPPRKKDGRQTATITFAAKAVSFGQS